MLYDVRSHGWNPVWGRQTHNFPTFVSDSQSIAREIDAHFGVKPRIGVFHSMSALIALLHQLQGESGFAALVLLDVPICPPRNTPEDNLEIGYTMAERARYRTVKFASLEDFSESLRRSRVFQGLQPGVIELFSQTTLRPDGEGGYELRCPREYEAQVFDYYFGWTMQAYEEMERFGPSCPAKAIGADPMVPFSFLPGMKLGTLSMMDYDFIPDSNPFSAARIPARVRDHGHRVSGRAWLGLMVSARPFPTFLVPWPVATTMPYMPAKAFSPSA